MKTNQKSQNECENTVTHEDRNRHRNTRDKRKDKMNRWHTGVHRKNGGKTVKDRKWEVKHDTRINLQNETGNQLKIAATHKKAATGFPIHLYCGSIVICYFFVHMA